MFIPDELKGAIRLFHGGELMAGTGGGQDTGGDLQDAQPDGDEHLFRIAGADLLVDGSEDLRGRKLMHSHMMDQGGRQHHEKGSGNALAGYVADDQAQVILINQEEVIQVAADLPGGGHGGIEIELMPVRERREDLGQEAGLDPGGQGKLRGDTLLFQLQGMAFHGGPDIMGNDGCEVQNDDSCRQPENMDDPSGQPEGPGADQGHDDDQNADESADAGVQPEEEEGDSQTEQRHGDELQEIRSLGLQVFLQEGLNDIGLVFHAVHGDTAIDRSDIGVLQGGSIGADEDDLTGPDIGRDLTHEEVQQGITVIESAGLTGEGNIVMTGFIYLRKGERLSLLFHVDLRGLGSHGIDLFTIGKGHIKQGMTKNAIHLIQHGVDMALGCDKSEGIIRLDKADNRGSIQGNSMAVFPGHLGTVFGHAGSDDIAELPGGTGQLFIHPGISFAFIEDVNGNDGGKVIRIRGELFQGIGDISAVVGSIGAQLSKGLVVDADDDNVIGSVALALVKGVLGLAVQVMEGARVDDGKGQDGNEKRDQEEAD